MMVYFFHCVENNIHVIKADDEDKNKLGELSFCIDEKNKIIEIKNIFVKENYRKNSIGTKLISHFSKIYKNYNDFKVYINFTSCVAEYTFRKAVGINLCDKIVLDNAVIEKNYDDFYNFNLILFKIKRLDLTIIHKGEFNQMLNHIQQSQFEANKYFFDKIVELNLSGRAAKFMLKNKDDLFFNQKYNMEIIEFDDDIIISMKSKKDLSFSINGNGLKVSYNNKPVTKKYRKRFINERKINKAIKSFREQFNDDIDIKTVKRKLIGYERNRILSYLAMFKLSNIDCKILEYTSNNKIKEVIHCVNNDNQFVIEIFPVGKLFVKVKLTYSLNKNGYTINLSKNFSSFNRNFNRYMNIFLGIGLNKKEG